MEALTVDEIAQEFDAVFIAIGAQIGKRIDSLKALLAENLISDKEAAAIRHAAPEAGLLTIQPEDVLQAVRELLAEETPA